MKSDIDKNNEIATKIKEIEEAKLLKEQTRIAPVDITVMTEKTYFQILSSRVDRLFMAETLQELRCLINSM